MRLLCCLLATLQVIEPWHFQLNARDKRIAGIPFRLYIGGLQWDEIRAVAVDRLSGHLYLAGFTESPDLTGAEWQRVGPGGSSDIVVMKLSLSSLQAAYAVRIGGSGADAAVALAVDSVGNAYLAGSTGSTDLPVTPGALKRSLGGDRDGFVAKLSPSGDLSYLTYLGGSQRDTATGIAVDQRGNAWVVGQAGPGFPAINASRPVYGNGADQDPGEGFLTKLDASGGSALYSSYVGGSGFDVVQAVAFDPSTNSVYVGGDTTSTDLPMAGVGRTTYAGGERDGFVMNLGSGGSSVAASTYLGGEGRDTVDEIVIGHEGRLHVTGSTTSRTFPVTPGAFQSRFGGEADAHVATLSKQDMALSSATYYGGRFAESATAIAVGPDGSLYLTGSSASPNLPITTGALPTPFSSESNGFIAKFSPDSGKLLFGTTVGGIGSESSAAIGIHGDGVVIAGGTTSADLPGADLSQGAYQGSVDSFVMAVVPHLRGTDAVLAGSGVVNASSLIPEAVAPGEIIAVYGVGLGPQTGVQAESRDGVFPRSLSGVELLVDGVAVPLLYVSGTQINAVMPFEIESREQVVVQARYGGVSTNEVSVPVRVAVPGVFTSSGDGQGQAAAVNQDGTMNSETNLAPRGSVISLFATGGGKMDPPLATGGTSRTLSSISLPVRAVLGTTPAEVLYAGSAPGLIHGLLQINVRVSESTTAGRVPVTLFIGDQPSQRNVFVMIR